MYTNLVVAKRSTVEEVMSSPDKEQWLNSMKKEMNMWELMELPKGQKSVRFSQSTDGKLNATKQGLFTEVWQ